MRCLMVESEAAGLSEEVMLGAVLFGHEQMQACHHMLSMNLPMRQAPVLSNGLRLKPMPNWSD